MRPFGSNSKRFIAAGIILNREMSHRKAVSLGITELQALNITKIQERAEKPGQLAEAQEPGVRCL